MENKLEMNDKNCKLLEEYLAITARKMKYIRREYLVNEQVENSQFIAMMRYFLRKDTFFKVAPFTKIEWLVLVLFYRLGIKLNEISLLVQIPLNQVKIAFFSGKEKLIIREKKCRLAP